MKSLILSLALLLATTSILNAQKNYLPDELTPDLLKEICENAALDVTHVDEEYIQVSSMYGYYLDIDPEKRYVIISGEYVFNDEATPEKIDKFLNVVNREVALIKAFTNEEHKSLTYIYYYWTQGGFTAKGLVGALKLMDLALDLCLIKDEDGVL